MSTSTAKSSHSSGGGAALTTAFLAGGAVVGALGLLLRRVGTRGHGAPAGQEGGPGNGAAKGSAAAGMGSAGKDEDSVSGGARLKGKVAVVTGASSGIGLAVARALHAEGAMVALGARRKHLLDSVVKDLGSDRALAVQTDVTSRPSVENLVSAAEEQFGAGVDILVNVAGVMYFTMMKNCQCDEWDRTVDVNCKGVLNGFGAVLGGMVKRGSGHIVTISSDAGRRIFPSLSVYCASKYFVEALSEGTRRELVGSGVRVTTIQPGDCATDLVRNNTDEEACAANGVKIGEIVGAGWANEWQLLQPHDVADAVVYAVAAAPHVAVNEILIEPRDQA